MSIPADKRWPTAIGGVAAFCAAVLCSLCLPQGCGEPGAGARTGAATMPCDGETRACGQISSADADEIADIRRLPQDCTAYLDPCGQVARTADVPLMSADEQAKAAQSFRARMVHPWSNTAAAPAPESVRKPFVDYAEKPGYGPNGRRRSAQWAQGMLSQAQLSDYPNADILAVSIRRTDLRDMPTDEPRFDGPLDTPDGYPFDMIQNTSVHPGTPARIWHIAGQWAYVRTGYAGGWAKLDDFREAPRQLQDAWRTGPMLACVRDDAENLWPRPTLPRGLRVGAIFPAGASAQALSEPADRPGSATSARSWSTFLTVSPGAAGDDTVAEDTIASACVRSWPLAMTPRNVAAVANQMLGEPYGWGGLYGYRDCSSTTMDIFTPFGLYLPRSSREQALLPGAVPLSHLAPAQREAEIVARGLPWATLIRSTGHIMLYIGTRDGRALVLHNFWGVPVRDASNPYGQGRDVRHIVGRCAITTLQPGIELPGVVRAKDRLAQVESMVFLAPRGVEAAARLSSPKSSGPASAETDP